MSALFIRDTCFSVEVCVYDIAPLNCVLTLKFEPVLNFTENIGINFALQGIPLILYLNDFRDTLKMRVINVLENC